MSMLWREFNPDRESIEAWLNRLKPSDPSLSRRGIAWLSVSHPERAPAADHFNEEPYVKLLRAITDAKDKPRHMKSTIREASMKGILETAKEQNHTSGKWILYRGVEHIDTVWGKIARATVQGRLGASAKVAPFTGGKSQLICVYVRDFTDRSEVEELLNALTEMELGVTGFKPDVFTDLDIYAGNKWGLETTIYKDLAKESKRKLEAKRKIKTDDERVKSKNVDDNYQEATNCDKVAKKVKKSASGEPSNHGKSETKQKNETVKKSTAKNDVASGSRTKMETSSGSAVSELAANGRPIEQSSLTDTDKVYAKANTNTSSSVKMESGDLLLASDASKQRPIAIPTTTAALTRAPVLDRDQLRNRRLAYFMRKPGTATVTKCTNQESKIDDSSLMDTIKNATKSGIKSVITGERVPNYVPEEIVNLSDEDSAIKLAIEMSLIEQ